LHDSIKNMKDLPKLERISSLKARTIKFLNHVTEDSIVVTHLAILKVLYALLNNLSDDHTYTIKEINKLTITDSDLHKVRGIDHF
jgi:hypothetical protein